MRMARVLISGASGLLGSALMPSLESHGYEVVRLVRRPPRIGEEIQWDPMREIPPQLVSGFDAVINLSGESVSGRWTEERKNSIRTSRVISTQNLSHALAQTENPPQTFVCASAIGFYGNRGEEVLTEESSSGAGFLAEVSREWEAATEPAAHAGIRTVNLRIGIVLGRKGGALKQMLLPFRLGLGGKIGSGRQWFSWIHIDDLVAAVLHILGTVERTAPSPSREICGPVNMTAPNPVTNAEFTKALGAALNRPTIFSVPAFAARLAFGEFADEGLLASARVTPQKLLGTEFAFRFPHLHTALGDLL